MSRFFSAITKIIACQEHHCFLVIAYRTSRCRELAYIEHLEDRHRLGRLACCKFGLACGRVGHRELVVGYKWEARAPRLCCSNQYDRSRMGQRQRGPGVTIKSSSD